MSALEEIEARPVRNILREYVSQVIAAAPGQEITLHDLIEGALADLGGNAEFVEAAARDIVPALMPELYREVFHRKKSIAVPGPGWFHRGTTLKLTTRERIALVYESTGQGSYKPLKSCTKLDLVTSRDRNRAHALSMNKWADLEDDLQGLLVNEEDVLGEQVPEEKIEEVWIRHYPEEEVSE